MSMNIIKFNRGNVKVNHVNILVMYIRIYTYTYDSFPAMDPAVYSTLSNCMSKGVGRLEKFSGR